MEKLNYRSWRYILQNQGDMVGSDIRNTHVACEWLSGNDNGRRFLKSQHSEECLRALDISHDDRQMIKMLQPVLDHSDRFGHTDLVVLHSDFDGLPPGGCS